MPRARSALLAVSLALAACGGVETKYDAARDVHAFITAAREGDEATFEKHVDRPALRASVAAELEEALRAQGMGALGGLLGPGAAEAAADRLITPQAFSFAAEQGGLKRTPTAAEIATQLKVLDQGRVCLQAQGACALTFASRGGVWKLVAVETAGLQVPGGPGGGLPLQEAWPGG